MRLNRRRIRTGGFKCIFNWSNKIFRLLLICKYLLKKYFCLIAKKIFLSTCLPEYLAASIAFPMSVKLYYSPMIATFRRLSEYRYVGFSYRRVYFTSGPPQVTHRALQWTSPARMVLAYRRARSVTESTTARGQGTSFIAVQRNPFLSTRISITTEACPVR